ncbi:hypothetical protein D3C72_1895140 [compost metagenome]
MAEVLFTRMAINTGRFGKVLFEAARKGLLVIELIFNRNIKNAFLRITQGESGEVQAARANIGSQRQTGLLFEHSLQIPFRVA